MSSASLVAGERTELLSLPLGEGERGLLIQLWRDFRRNRGAVIGMWIVVALVLCAVFADVIAPYSPSEQYRDATLQPPSLQPIGGHVFVLGTDPVGRDLLSRLIHGTRLSLLIGLASVGLSRSAGIVLGPLAGFFRGGVEFTIMRLMDISFGSRAPR